MGRSQHVVVNVLIFERGNEIGNELSSCTSARKEMFGDYKNVMVRHVHLDRQVFWRRRFSMIITTVIES